MDTAHVAVTPTHRHRRPRSGGPTTRKISLVIAGALVAGVIALDVGSATAAPPDFPNNIVVFPDRDFVTFEGFQDHIGETATVEVTRAGVGIIGSAQAVVAEGDVAFEINHPGGACWGAGTNLKVTPDIQGGDVVAIRFGATQAGDTTVADAGVTEVQYVQGSTTLKVVGHLGPGVNPDQLEQRIVNPALRTTAVNRRDVRAVPGPLATAPRGGYSSALATTGSTFTATYQFDDPAVAAIAATGGGQRLMAWQVQDADANRQGLTISEFGELGGPGMGGCPNGPLTSGPPGPTGVSATVVNGGIKLNWTPAVAVPGTPAITGYRVTAVSQTVSGNEQAEIGKRITGQAAKTTTITGLSSSDSYEFEIVSVSSSGLTFPAVTAIPVTDVQPPTVTATPAAGTYAVPQTVTLTSNEANTDIYYTTDNALDLLDGDSVSVDAVHYTGPVSIANSSTLRWVAFDVAGNLSADQADYSITNTPVPAAPVLGAPTLGNSSVTVAWTTNDPSVTEFTVQAFDSTHARFGDPQTVTASPVTISGLVPGDSYTVEVSATNANGTSAAAVLGPFAAQGAVNANAGPDQQVRRNTTVTLNGGASTQATGVTYLWEQVLTGATDPDKVTLNAASTLTPSFSYPLYKYPMTNNPLTFKLTVSDGTTSKTDTVLVAAIPDKPTIATAKWKSGDFRITGSNTTVGATITVRAFNNPSQVLGTFIVTAAVPPATGGVYDLRIRTGAGATTNPGRIYVDSSFGGTVGPFTVTT